MNSPRRPSDELGDSGNGAFTGWLRRNGGPIVIALVGVTGLLLMTRWGIGTSPDSVHYLRSAAELLGPVDPVGSTGATSLPVQHAPLYPVVLALGAGVLGLDVLDAARWVSAVVFGVNVLLLGLIVDRLGRHARWLSSLGCVLFISAMPVLGVHAVALSEPLYLLFTLAGLLLLAAHVEGGCLATLVGSGLALGLALLARYAGAAGLLAGGLALLLWGRRDYRERLRDLLTFGVVASLPMLGWMARNLATAGSAAGRELELHPIGWTHAWQTLYTVAGWLLVPAMAPDVVRMMACGAVVGGGVALVVRRSLRRRGSHPYLIPVLGLFAGVYMTFLALSISFFDANTPLDDRILLPVFVIGAVLLLHGADQVWGATWSARWPWVRYTLVAMLLVFVGGHALTGSSAIAAGYSQGWGFSSRAWQRSPSLGRIRQLGEQTVIYANAPEIVYLHTGRHVEPLPRTRRLMTGRPNDAFADEMRHMKRRLAADCGIVLYFRGLSSQMAVPTAQALQTELGLETRSHEADGLILGPTECPE